MASAMANTYPLSLLCLLVFSLLFSCSLVNGGEMRKRSHAVRLNSLKSSNNLCSSTFSGSNSNRLPIVQRHGPCSPFHGLEALKHKDILRRDTARVNALHQNFPLSSTTEGSAPASSPSASVTIPDGVGTALGSLDYIVTVGYGTPPKNFSVIFDTGSDISWIQCEPCVGQCYPQKDPLFNPSQSSTYANISCNSAECSLVGGNCEESNCIYAVQYGDSSFSAGYFAKETLSLTPLHALKNFEFGCGEMNEGLFGRVAGLIGLGKGKVSLASQAAPIYGGAFSYCLPPFDRAIGHLTIGNHLPPGDEVQYTPMITKPNAPSFYFVELVGLGVGGRNLSIPPAVFTKVGTIIDSGTVVTYLPPTAYSALRDEFRRWMRRYKMRPPFAIFDTCYDFTGLNLTVIPIVTLEFGNGVTIDLPFFGIMYFIDSSWSQACLAFAAAREASEFSIIGNVQQRSMEVVYDLDRSMIGFSQDSC